jgi:ribosomal protein L19E
MTDFGEAVVEVGISRVKIQDEFIEEIERNFGRGVLRVV